MARRTKRSKSNGLSISMAPVRMLKGDKQFTTRVVKVGLAAVGVYGVIAIGRAIFGGK